MNQILTCCFAKKKITIRFGSEYIEDLKMKFLVANLLTIYAVRYNRGTWAKPILGPNCMIPHTGIL